MASSTNPLTEKGFFIRYLYASWVPALKTYKGPNPAPDIESEVLPTHNRAFKYFVDIFDTSLEKANIQILFKSDGMQSNVVRSDLLAILKASSEHNMKAVSDNLARRLARFTDKRSGNGLFVIVVGEKSGSLRIALNRFREDEVVTADRGGKQLDVDLLNNAFSKRSTHYKLAAYQDILSDRAFWEGFAIDRQRSNKGKGELSDYWIYDFLESQLHMTPKHGTRVFSRAVKMAMRSDIPVAVKQEFVAGLLALKARAGQLISLESFGAEFLSSEGEDLFREVAPDEKTYGLQFELDEEEFNEQVGIKTVYLSNTVTISAPVFEFDDYVHSEATESDEFRFSTQGNINDVKLGGK